MPSSGGRPPLAEPMQPRRPNPSVIPYSGNEVFPRKSAAKTRSPEFFRIRMRDGVIIGKRWNHTSEVSPGPLGAAASAVATGWFHRFRLRVHFWIPEWYFFGSISGSRNGIFVQDLDRNRHYVEFLKGIGSGNTFPGFHRILIPNMPSACPAPGRN